MIYSKRNLNLILAFLCVLSCLAAAPAAPADTLTARKVFAEAPLEVLDMLRPTTRLDMLDYYTEADSIFAATDALGGKSRLVTVADDYMKVSVTPVSTLEIKILPYKKGFIAMTLYTVGGDSIAKDTEISFFDSNFKELSADRYLKKLDSKAFFNLKNTDISGKEFCELVPFASVCYTTGPGETPLTATFTTLSVLSQESRKRLQPYLTPSLTATWTGVAYKFRLRNL